MRAPPLAWGTIGWYLWLVATGRHWSECNQEEHIIIVIYILLVINSQATTKLNTQSIDIKKL